MRHHSLTVGLALVLGLSACQKAADKAEAQVQAIVEAVPECQAWAGPEPRGVHAVDLDSTTLAVLADCSVEADQAVPMRQLYVRGADGVLKQQMLLIYNGPGYEPDYTWEAVGAGPIAVDPSTNDIVLDWKTTARSGEAGLDDIAASRSVVTWRWETDHFAMVSATYEEGTPLRRTGAWPTTPPTDDPTGPPFVANQPR